MYRTICTELWTDPEIKTLDVPTKLLFVYLITNPHTHLSGIYYLPEETALKETGLKKIPYQYGIDTLSELGKAYRDERTETIFVTNMFRYQGRGEKNEKAAANHLKTLHKSPLVKRFFDTYPQILVFWSGYPIDTLSYTPSGSGKRCPPVPDPDSDSESSDLKSNGQAKLKGKTAVPKDWILPEEERLSWAKFGLNPLVEFAAFKDHALTNDRRCSDWPAAFRNWCRKSIAKLEVKL